MPCFFLRMEAKEWVHDPRPYILPATHPLKSILDTLFPTRDSIYNTQTMKEAGFMILREQRSSGILLATHPRLKGYLIKLYLESQQRHRRAFSQQEWLIQRCRGAEKIRKCIQKHRMQHFTVPDKWLYELPSTTKEKNNRTFILVATYMNLVTPEETGQAWRSVTKDHLKELRILMKTGGTSGAFIINVPYTREGKFAFIDTEYADRIFSKEKLRTLSPYFSPDMGLYWLHLVEKK